MTDYWKTYSSADNPYKGESKSKYPSSQDLNHVTMDPKQLVYKSSSLAILNAKKNGQDVSNDGATDVDLTNARRILTFMYNMWNENRMCDVVLRTADDNLFAHKMTLGAYSDLLAKQFSADSHGEMSTIDLSLCPTDIVKQILHFVYTTDITITDSNISDLIGCSRQLGLDIVLAMCMDNLQSYNTNNALLYYNIAEKHNLQELRNSIFLFICAQFAEISQTTAFLHISYEKLQLFLSDDRLAVTSELDSFYAMKRWVDYNRLERLRMIPVLMKYVRLQLIVPAMLVEHVQAVDYVINFKECYDQLYTTMV